LLHDQRSADALLFDLQVNLRHTGQALDRADL
jgi:hypothetical protein